MKAKGGEVASWVFAKKEGITRSVTLELSSFQRTEEKSKAWSSPRRRPEAKARRKTVFHVRNFNGAVDKGSNGADAKRFKTRERSHWGTSFRATGRSTLKLLRRALKS